MDPNKYYDEEQDTLQNWQKYLQDTHERSSHMWNSILYNQFVNEEVRRLQRKIYYIKDDLKKEKSTIDKLSNDNKKLTKSLDKYEKQEDSNINKRKRSELSKWLTSEKRKKPRNYESLDNEEVTRRLTETMKLMLTSTRKMSQLSRDRTTMVLLLQEID